MLDAIRHGLRTFDTTFFQAPGRMNVFNEHPFKVIMDYAHNAHAVGHDGRPAQRLDASRRIVVVAGPGDRRDEDLREIAQVVAGKFDHYMVRRDDSCAAATATRCRGSSPGHCRRRGWRRCDQRDPGRTGSGGRGPAHGARPAIRCWCFADALTRSWKQIIRFKPEGDLARAAPRVEIPALETTWTTMVAAMEGVVRDRAACA